MKLILCLDDENGIQFNKRRQSRDVEAYKKMLSLAEGTVLWMKPGSQKLFEGLEGQIRTDENCLAKAGSGEFCFVEDGDVFAYLPEAEGVYVFRWNRVYPADLKLAQSMLKENLCLVKTEDFAGKSHDLITLEVYDRAN